MARKNLAKRRAVPYPESGNILLRFRQRAERTQETFAPLVGLSEPARYRDYERGRRLPTLKLARQLYNLYVAGTSDRHAIDDWEHLRDILLPPAPSELPEAQVLLLEQGEGEDLREVPELVRRVYTQWPKAGESRPRISPALRHPTSRIFRFKEDEPVPILTSALINVQENIDSPPHDRAAAQALLQRLAEVNRPGIIERCPQASAAEYARGSVVAVGGPSLNPVSAAINRFFRQTGTWFRGFYFAEARPCRDCPTRYSGRQLLTRWEIQCHAVPEAPGIEMHRHPPVLWADVYPPLADGRAQDYGIVYVGPNPLNAQHWLVLVAGLGGMGSVGAAHTFNTPAAFGLMAQCLTDRHLYCSVLLRYRFRDKERASEGSLASVALIGGVGY